MERMQLFYDQIGTLPRGQLVDMMLERANQLLSPDAKKKDGYEILRLQLELDAINVMLKLKSRQDEAEA